MAEMDVGGVLPDVPSMDVGAFFPDVPSMDVGGVLPDVPRCMLGRSSAPAEHGCWRSFLVAAVH
jgi:hypothetical protein